jgi:hypothetical protein
MVADSLSGENGTFEGALRTAGLSYPVEFAASQAFRAPVDAVTSPQEGLVALHSPEREDPGHWTKIV